MSIIKLIKKFYASYWCPRLFFKKCDGGKESGVTGYFLIEWKPVFSVGILHFSEGSREAYHNHAFNALTFWLSGHVLEKKITGEETNYKGFSFFPKYTKRTNCHKVIGIKPSLALTVRGNWTKTWYEIRDDIKLTLKHSRIIVNRESL
jgi:hypothetical protein